MEMRTVARRRHHDFSGTSTATSTGKRLMPSRNKHSDLMQQLAESNEYTSKERRNIKVTPAAQRYGRIGRWLLKKFTSVEKGALGFFSMVPGIVLIIITSAVLREHYDEIVEANEEANVVSFSAETNKAIHDIVLERALTAYYLAVPDVNTKRKLVAQYVNTDQDISKLSTWPTLMSSRDHRFLTKNAFQQHLRLHRFNIKSDAAEGERIYTELIDHLTNWFDVTVKGVNTGIMWQELVVIFDIIRSKLAIGLSLVYGINYFARGGFETRDNYIGFMKERVKANRSLSSALQFAGVAGEQYRQFTEDADRLSLLHRIENAKMDNVTLEPDSALCTQVFVNITLYVNELVKMESAIQVTVIERVRNLVWQNSMNMIGLIGINAITILFSALIVTFVVSFVSDFQFAIMQLMKTNDALNEAKRKTMGVLVNMFPGVVVNKLQQQQSAGMEHFIEVTVLFADMVGFTTISSLSTPEQVYNMLNFLFTYFDDLIKRRDVFKVQTIGDAYVVASGVPVPNGKQHVIEIALLALDFRGNLNKLEIPHMSGVNYNLRIGMATGSVLAGVVDKKTPRYCLLGDTMQRAVHLEETGEEGKIHIDRIARNRLVEIGGFEMVPKTTPTLESTEMVTYWLVGQA